MTDRPAATNVPATTALPDQDAMDIKTLARAVLAREFRPRTAAIRRLAEAVLAKGAPKPKKKKDGKKARKLATIPGQKGRKKG